MTLFDTSGIETWVTENNLKYANRVIIKQVKTYAKSNHFDKNYDSHKAAYASMPTHEKANPCTTSSCGRMIYIYPEKIFVHIHVLSVVCKNRIKFIRYE